MKVKAYQFTFELWHLGAGREPHIFEVKHEGRILAQPPAERRSHTSEENREGRVSTLSVAEHDSHILELKREGRVVARP